MTNILTDQQKKFDEKCVCGVSEDVLNSAGCRAHKEEERVASSNTDILKKVIAEIGRIRGEQNEVPPEQKTHDNKIIRKLANRLDDAQKGFNTALSLIKSYCEEIIKEKI